MHTATHTATHTTTATTVAVATLPRDETVEKLFSDCPVRYPNLGQLTPWDHEKNLVEHDG